jgi:hypothetical protein
MQRVEKEFLDDLKDNIQMRYTMLKRSIESDYVDNK